MEDMIKTVILPTLASANTTIVRQQEEVSHMLFQLLAAQQRWEVVHLLVVKGASVWQSGDRGVPAALAHLLASLDVHEHSQSDGGQVFGPMQFAYTRAWLILDSVCIVQAASRDSGLSMIKKDLRLGLGS